MLRARSLLVFAALLAVVVASAVLFACSQTPTTVPLRTFDRAQRMDVVCLKVTGGGDPLPLPQEACAPVPPDVNGSNLDNQLFALVTQTTRGEVAVVDLSAGVIIDQRHSIPGLNFLPVGANPTDIAATPDGRMAFVASAEPNKFALYGIPGHRLLGDTAFRDPAKPAESVTLASWPVCALPQRPGALSIVPRRTTPGVVSDAGTADAGAAGVIDVPYEVVVVLPGDRTSSAKVLTLDPRPFLRGSPRKDDAGNVDNYGDGTTIAPGSLAPCPITAAMELSGEEALPATFVPGKAWQDGVPWIDGGVDTTCSQPAKAASCGLPACECIPPPLPLDAGADAGNAGTTTTVECSADAGKPDDAERALDLGPLDAPVPVAIARDDQTLYIADDGVPLIHVIDLSTPGAPRELPPFIVTSVVEPSRVVSIRDLALSPPTHEFKRFLYAVDRKEGSIAVFDVTDPVNAERTPMRRPHSELNPFQPPDRISFSAPVVTVAFARHDVPVSRIHGLTITNPATGLLCNPNPNVDTGPNRAVNGADYRADSQNVDVALGPRPTSGRLRGIFAFATLSNGQIVAIDVDDWDAPCRRPADLSGTTPVGVLAAPQPATGDLDAYHAPTVDPNTVSQERFFPVSAPHRARSNYFLRDDSTTGKYIPFLVSSPSLTARGSVAPPLVGAGSEGTPKLRPTAATAAATTGGAVDDTAAIGVRFSFDVPDVHLDQDWDVTYEGALPGFDGFPGVLTTTDDYATITLSQPQARFCAKGVEDWSLGKERASAISSALADAHRAPYPEPLESRLVDYVQVADEILAPSDPFWGQSDLPGPDACWDPGLDTAQRRFEFCANQFGTAGEENANRDFPILEAYDDHVVLGRFSQDGTRSVVTGRSNVPYLKALRCCFHHQTTFKIRTGGQWVTFGTLFGLLSHVTPGPGGRCLQSCEENAVLRNARAPSLPYGGAASFAPFRDSPLAIRNPTFSFFVQNGQTKDGGDKQPDRDMKYRFQTRGGFQPLAISLATTTTSVNPQSMRFIESLGQIAVVDGASQGLVLIDLGGVGIARAPYF